MARFQMRIDRVWAPAVLVGGATRSNSYVDVTPEAVTFHFGYIFNHTQGRDEIRDVRARSWPWWMGIGWRSNLRGLLGLVGSYRNVVEVSFERRSLAWGVLPMDRIAISVEDPEGLIKALKPPASAKAKKPPAKRSARRSTRNNGTATKRRTKRKAE
ncbi:MAG: hypothetical protein J4O14_09900 [Chloroflexi bacterium]|nr:hypothetical protein [Chloroflexota bacterium]MCH7953285.1 hypothetical protein [Chloroflexota bacterium]MCI0783361.1 hypothetical protein [Chloroflexota bacterium]MCI0813991.1 hypothetical protein [Chloroflexota bacterium]MCI0818568.1 hypothetical protein [Chloroflexota bacterium]